MRSRIPRAAPRCAAPPRRRFARQVRRPVVFASFSRARRVREEIRRRSSHASFPRVNVYLDLGHAPVVLRGSYARFDVSATLRAAAASRRVRVPITPVNWPFSHVNQVHFASAWPTFAIGRRPRTAPAARLERVCAFFFVPDVGFSDARSRSSRPVRRL